MDELRFDCLTRRLVLRGFVGGLLAPFAFQEGSEAEKLSKRRRCKRKRRDFCAGRCCPRKRQCIDQTCVESCNAPFQCPPDGPADTECGPDGSCFCGKTPGGKAACVAAPFPTFCNDLPECISGVRCPEGQVCFTCFCDAGVTPNFRCAPPC